MPLLMSLRLRLLPLALSVLRRRDRLCLAAAGFGALAKSAMKHCMNRLVAFAAFSLASFSAPAFAHPHVWIDARAEVLFDGAKIAGVRHAWVFDEAFSTFVVQGLDANKDGKYSREELAQLAKENVESLEEFDFFTFAKIAGRDAAFNKPGEEWLEFDGKLLTLHFDLPLKEAVPLRQAIIEVYDPSYYVEFKFANDAALSLASAPAGCSGKVQKPPELDTNAQQKLAEADFNQLDSAFSAGFANRAIVACP
jgi:ABC-type uncharacterized transport system substrate-binding protein